ncbi:MAG: MG2 domain-containing protein, partial [Planctomycetota bacterium]
QRGGSWRQRSRVVRHFESAVEAGPAHDWFDDALFQFAGWMSQQGRVVRLKDGNWRQEQDFVRAVELYQRLLREFRPGESQYLDDARRQIEQITGPMVSVQVSNIFLPGSEVQYHVSWRNVERVQLKLYPINLVHDIDARRSAAGPRDWEQLVDLAATEPIRSWSIDTDDDGRHLPGNRQPFLEEPLAGGAYVLAATAGGKSARQLVLVTDISVVTKVDGQRMLVFCCDAIGGAPLADSEVRLWSMRWTGQRWIVRDQTKRTDEQGLAEFTHEMVDSSRSSRASHFVAAHIEDRQAIARVDSYAHGSSMMPWRIYTFSDRPAYRPEETVHWKAIARQYDDQGARTPDGTTIAYRITGPQGNTVDEGPITLNEFGSAWGELSLSPSMRLGQYAITFFTENQGRHLGGGPLFRLEEYKLPEFVVNVRPPEKDGTAVVYQVGDTIEVDVIAEYYFGGPVSEATIEAVVYQKPFNHWWARPREFPWCYEPGPQGRWWYGPGQIVARQTLKTDVTGRATVTFETPEFAGQDFEYRIEARVTDASRREIAGTGSIRVTRQRYYVYPQPRHQVYEPQDQVEIDIKTVDANNNPVQVTGRVTVTRDTWREIWIDPEGRTVSGDRLERLREGGVFPPPPEPGARPWRLKFRGYEPQTITTSTVRTDAMGEGIFVFTPPTDGYYRMTWRSPNRLDSGGALLKEQPEDQHGDWITAEAMVWVASDRTRFIGYHHGGVDLIVDRDTVRVGEHAAVMVSTAASGRHVLLTVEGDHLYDHQLVHVPGNVRLIRVPIRDEHVPNVFLGATVVADARMLYDRETLVVPPVEQYLDITVTPDRAVYEPQQTGSLTVSARDHKGEPVAAEVALALFDESVLSIQGDLAGDPRQFFFQQRQAQRVQTASTFHHRPYLRLEREVEEPDADERLVPGAGGGFGGGQAKREGGRSWTSSEMADDAGAFAPAPAAQAPMEEMERKAERQDADMAGGGSDAPPLEVEVRQDFRSTLLWLPTVRTDANGLATVPVHYADSLTRWKAVARASSLGNQFGLGETTSRTRKPLIARLQAPRFFVVGDRATVSAVINNNTDQPMPVRTELVAAGLTVVGMQRDGRIADAATTRIDVPGGQEARVDWIVEVEEAGPVKLTLAAR